MDTDEPRGNKVSAGDRMIKHGVDALANAQAAAEHTRRAQEGIAGLAYGVVYGSGEGLPAAEAPPVTPPAPIASGNESGEPSDDATGKPAQADAAGKPKAEGDGKAQGDGKSKRAIEPDAKTRAQAEEDARTRSEAEAKAKAEEEEAAARAAAGIALAATLHAQVPAPVAAAPSRPRFADFVHAPNQKSVANAVQALPRTHPLYGSALDALDHGNLGKYVDSLSGEVHATVATSVMAVSTLAREVPLAQLRDNLAARMLPGAPTATWGDSPAGAAPHSSAKPLWAHVGGSWQKFGGRDHAARGDQNSAGLFLGTDHDLGNGWRLGGALGFTDSHLKLRSLDSKANTTSYSAVLYGGKVLPLGPGALHAIVGTGYTWNDVKTRRQASAGGLDQTLRAKYGVSTVQWFAELGYSLPVAQGLTLQPYAGLAYADNHGRGFKEYGGSAALTGHRQRSDTTTLTLGLRGKQDIELGSVTGQVIGGLGWRHNTGAVHNHRHMSFNMGDSFTVTGAPIARDVALVEAGVKFDLDKNTDLGIHYAGQFGASQRDNTVGLMLGHRF
ncbi:MULTISPECIES: autotransporter outer membrane beta-barrel domain-containing protein [unclassified Achromobacter]|uniref:autotransporter outer membrane beta-barrel domain-containing protein n=1 Tax=unclassified Achromobacter TaxID=2626865 RepID=UPI001303B01E|nr:MULTISPECIES: autotransporter outer membrane beta-barrel domain-containing protein [unclassified Achromobacter]